MHVSEAIAAAFAAEGCDTVFGLLGDANMPVWAALATTPGIALYSARHEAGAVAMADGHARASGRIGVATITSGPGLTQTGTSLMAASRNRTPMVVAVGNVATTDRHNVQKMDQRRFAQACGAAFHPVTGAGNLAAELLEAFHAARHKRCPVVLDLPVDVQGQVLEWAWEYTPSYAWTPAPPGCAPAAQVEELAQSLRRAERPVIIAGYGAKAGGAREELLELSQRSGALLATTLKAKGLFAGAPYDIGIAGAFSSAPAERLLGQADFVLGVGAELGYYTTEGGLLFPEARVARIDASPQPEQLGPVPGQYLCGDAKQTVAALNAALAKHESGRRGFHDDVTLAILRADTPLRDPAPDGLDPRRLARELGCALPGDATVTVGAGHFWCFFHMYTPVRPEVDLHLCYQFGAIGQTLPLAVGIAAARPGRPHLVVEGDGSIMMNLQELETVVRLGLRMAVLVWNDCGFGAEAHKLRARGMDPGLGRWASSPDFVALARAFGGEGERIEREADVAPALERALAHPGLYVIDAQVSPSVVSDPYLKLQFGAENRAPLLRLPAEMSR